MLHRTFQMYLRHIFPSAVVLASAFGLVAAEPTISVAAQPRYPWNGKVDVKFTITGESGVKYDTSFTAKDVAGGTNLTLKTLYKSNGAAANPAKEPLLPGNYSWVWDAQADLGADTVLDRVTVNAETVDSTLYMVIDLSSGASSTSYPVTYLASAPSSGFTNNTYRTTKLALRRCNAGSFKMQGATTTTLTKPFYMGVFEVTQKQWMLVMGSDPCSSTSYGKGDGYPVHYVSYNMIRGSSNGAKWPSSSAVDATSFLGKLQARTKLNFDLPTEAQWEYACRAGTTTTYYWGSSMNGDYAWYTSNSSSKSHPVGMKKPNAWGLYDMSGNVWEGCLDWYGSSLAYGTDPKGSSSGSDRVLRGGSWHSNESYCASPYRYTCSPSSSNNYGGGFRLSLTLP